VFKALEGFNNEPIVEQIECPVLVMEGAEEVFSEGESRRLYDALRCPKELMVFDAGSAAQLHCQNGALGHAAERPFDWLEDHL
jgi:hypothetical protein